VRNISSLFHAPGSGKRLFATAGLAALAVAGVSFNGTPTASAAPSLDKAELAAATAVPGAAAVQTVVNQNTPRPDGATKPAVADWPQLKFAANATSVISGRDAVFGATAKHHDGSAYAAAAVELQQLQQGRWVTIATRKTAANGTVGFNVKVNSTQNYRVGVDTIPAVQHAAVSGRVTVTKVDPGNLIVAMAARFAGRPYVFGAAGPRYFDCSGLVLYTYKHVMGMNLPHSAAYQDHYGVRISRAQARPGDLIFFRDSTGWVHHVAIYTGGDMMWEAPHTGSYVRHVKIWDSRVEFRRLVQH